nr:hypothetical protein [Moraxella sp. CTOTU48717]
MQYYRKLQSAHSNQTLTMLDGAQTQRYGRLERGVIQGDCRNMQVIIADEKGFDGLGFDATIGSQDDSYAVVNLFDSVNRYIDSVAIAGADDADHAIHLALSQFDYLEPAYATLVANEGDGSFEPSFDSLCWESDTIGKLMNNRSQDRGHYLPIITQKMLVTEKNRVTHNDVLWDGVNLVSHEGDYSRLLVDIQKNDSHHELTAQFDMAGFLANLDVTELGLDALMDTNNRLDLMKERLFRALAKQSVDGLSVTDAVLTKPFKKAGMANVAMQFNLSDGQTFTILFHNPDADPKKLSPQDTMVSWKWMLNKRDITAAVSPKNGENVQLAPLATRMMKVAKANSKRFAAAQSKKAQNQQALTDAQKEVDDKKAKLDTINAHIAELQGELEKVSSADDGNTEQATTTTADLTARQQAAAMEKFNEAKSILLDNGWRQFNKNSLGVEYPYYANGTEGRIITAYPQDDGHATVKVIAGLNDDETENVIGHVMSDMAKDAQDLAQQLNNLVKNWVLDNGHSLHPIIEQEEKLAQTDKPLSEPTEPTPKPQSTAPTSELSPEERKLNKLIKERDMMKDINKITRMKISDDEKIAKIMEFGIKQDTARTLATGEGTWDKRQGFAPYELTSINNRIKTLQAKVDAMKKADEINNSLGGEDMVLAGVSIILNKEADRIQLDFPSKPSRDVIAILKKNGWKWSPSNQVWQRQLTENAMRNARTMVEAYADDEGIDMEDETNTTPTQAAPQTPPEPEGGDVSKLTQLDETTRQRLKQAFTNGGLKVSALTDEAAALMALVIDRANGTITEKDLGNLFGSTNRLFDGKPLNDYYLKGDYALSQPIIDGYNKVLSELDNINSAEIPNYIFVNAKNAKVSIIADTNPDADYLQTVIDGSIGLSTDNMKQVITEIKRIAKAGAVDKDLLNQAIEAYQTFALSVKVA